MATRVRLPSSGSASPLQPAVGSVWETDLRIGTQALAWSLVKLGTALADSGAGFSSYRDICLLQLVSDTLDVDQTIAGTFSAVVAGLGTGGPTNPQLKCYIRVVKPDGTDRGVLLNLTGSGIGSSVYPNDLGGDPKQTRTINAVAITSVAALAGDRICLEVGVGGQTIGTSITVRFGDPSATADFALTDGLTTDLDPWVEFSQTITFGAAPTQHATPDGDVADGSWTNETGATTLAPSVADVTDTTYIKSASNPVADLAKLSLSNPGTPVAGTWTLHVRHKKIP